jgi:ribosomal protein S18 acetylase RimI-like enzyme
MSDAFELLVEDNPDPDHVRQLISGLVAFTATGAEAENHRPLAVFCRQGDHIVGGADGYTHWQWLHVSHLWVADALRRQSVGQHLMHVIEEQARRRGCRAAWLDTFSFQAPGFYEALGYRQFGTSTNTRLATPATTSGSPWTRPQHDPNGRSLRLFHPQLLTLSRR